MKPLHTLLQNQRQLGKLLILFICTVIIATATKEAGLFRFIEREYHLMKIPYLDKVGHFLAVGTLTLIANLYTGCATYRVSGLPVLKASLWILLITTIEEMSQAYRPTRSWDIYDEAANALGVVTFSIIALYIHASHKADTA